MQFPYIRMFVALVFLVFSLSVRAQENISREVEIHKNVKLIELAPAPDIPEDMLKQYGSFLPILEETLKENTTDQSDACLLTIRVKAGIKEIGSAKVKRPTAQVTAYRRNSRQEFLGTLILYSYVTAGPVNKEETAQFLNKQILEPAECRSAE
jgi:hypothetical protein